MAQSSARKASLKKALQASIEKRARITEGRRSNMAALIEERWLLKEISTDSLMATFTISRSTLDRDVAALREKGLLPRDFMLRTKKQIKEARTNEHREVRIRAFIADGLEIREMAKKLRISKRRVRRLISGMEKRGDRRLQTAVEYARSRKRIKTFEAHEQESRELQINLQAKSERVKAMEEELGESLEERNFTNTVIYYGDLLEDIQVHWNPYFTNQGRAKLIRMGVVVKAAHKPTVMSEKARLLLMDYRAGKLSPRVNPTYEEEDELEYDHEEDLRTSRKDPLVARARGILMDEGDLIDTWFEGRLRFSIATRRARHALREAQRAAWESYWSQGGLPLTLPEAVQGYMAFIKTGAAGEASRIYIEATVEERSAWAQQQELLRARLATIRE